MYSFLKVLVTCHQFLYLSCIRTHARLLVMVKSSWFWCNLQDDGDQGSADLAGSACSFSSASSFPSQESNTSVVSGLRASAFILLFASISFLPFCLPEFYEPITFLGNFCFLTSRNLEWHDNFSLSKIVAQTQPWVQILYLLTRRSGLKKTTFLLLDQLGRSLTV